MHDPIESPWRLYRRLLSYSLSYRGYFLIAATCMAVTSASEFGFAWMMKPLVNGGFVQRDFDSIRLLPLMVVGIFVARGLSGFAANYIMNWIGRMVIFRLRHDLFSRLVHLPSRFYDTQSSGILVAKVIYDVEQVMMATTKAVSSIVKDSLSLMALLGLMFYRNWKLTLAFAAVAPLLALAIRIISRRFRMLSRRIQESMGDITQVVQEAIEGQRVIKTFNAQAAEIHAFDEVNGRNRRQAMKKAATAAINVPVVELLAALGVAAVIFFALREAAAGRMDAGDFMSYLTALLLMLPAIKRLSEVNETIQTGVAAAASVFRVMDERPEPDEGTQTLTHIRGQVSYQNVTFAYPESTRAAVEAVSFTVEPGQTVALVGASGSGKTTCAQLLPRFYFPDHGEIRLDGVDIRALTLQNLRSHIALVSQETLLFDDSIRANIAYARSGPVDETRLMQAARAAHIIEFAERLPGGMASRVGERGARLSGGQRQRIAIARALYKDAPVLILDEATSALDTESERLVQEAMQQLMRGRSTLVIAHRLSTIESADRIVVLAHGRIIETGTHADLIARGGAYARLHRMQFSDNPASP